MPKALEIDGFVFYFYSNEGNEPCHVHVRKADSTGKIWLEPTIQINYLDGFSTSERRRIESLIEEHYSTLKAKWYEYFSGK